jgi:trans-2-enoyl-CoA reductase
MFTYKVIEILDEITEDVDDLVYYADPSRQQLDSRAVHIRLKKIQKAIRLMSLDILVNGDKLMAEDIEKTLRKQKQCR